MIFKHLSVSQHSHVSQKIKLTLKIALPMLCLSIAIQASAGLLFHDDFEKDKIGSEPSKWEVGFDGATTAKVVADPKKASNKVLLTADKGSNQARHDVGGSIYVVGDAGWDDYVAEWDMMFPDDFYMGVVFRFQDGEKFYLSDRRQGGRDYHFYKRQGGWALVQAGLVENDPEVWYRAQLILSGDKFTFKLKERKTTARLTKSILQLKAEMGTSRPVSSATTDSFILITSLSAIPSKTSSYPLNHRINSAQLGARLRMPIKGKRGKKEKEN